MREVSLWLLGGLAVVAVASVAVAGWQSVRLSDAEADTAAARTTLTATERERDDARAEVARIAAEHQAVVVAMTEERRHSAARGSIVAELRERLARDAGTVRDAPTAPTLADALAAIVEGAK